MIPFSRKDSVLILAIILVGIGLISCAAQAEILTGEPKKEWVSGLKNQDGNVCCSEADGVGVRTEDWDIRGNDYWVKLQDGEWHKVEPWMLVSGPNKAGYAIVWTYGANDGGSTDEDGYGGPLKYNIRCFIPGTLG